MLEYLDKLSPELKERRITLITNVRAGSSSFYTAYRSLCEEFTRHALRAGGFDIDSGARISLVLSRPEVIEYFEELGAAADGVEKIRNYVLKINKHLHEKEKPFDTELTVKYIRALYVFTSPFAKASGITVTPPDDDAIRSICKTHGDIESARAEVMQKSEQMFHEIKDTIDDRFQSIDDTMQKMQSSLDEFIAREEDERKQRELEKKIEEDIRLHEERRRAAEEMAKKAKKRAEDEQKAKEENERLKEYRIKNIIQTAPKYFAYIKEVLTFSDAKKLLIFVTSLSFIIPIAYFEIINIVADMVSVFSFGVIFWEIMMIILFIKVLLTKEIHPISSALDIFPTGVIPISHGSYLPDGINKKYIAAATLAGICLIFDALIVNSVYKGLIAFMLIMIVIIIALMVTTCILASRYYNNYSVVIHRGKIGSGDTYVDQNVINAAGIIMDETTFISTLWGGRQIVYPD